MSGIQVIMLGVKPRANLGVLVRKRQYAISCSPARGVDKMTRAFLFRSPRPGSVRPFVSASWHHGRAEAQYVCKSECIRQPNPSFL